MKFIVCLVLLVACAKALAQSRVVRSTGTCDEREEVRIAAGEILEGAIVSDTGSDGKYPSHACQQWKIIADENQCLVITVDDGGFNTESFYDPVMFKDFDTFAETKRSGEYSTGDVLFISDTNNVNVKFTSDVSQTRNGFSLDIRSTSCTEAEKLEEDEEPSETIDIFDNCDDTTVREVEVAAGETLQGALVTYTENDGKYPNNACQTWKIITDENQCISIVVGAGGFELQYDYDIAWFKDSDIGDVTRESEEYSLGHLLFKSETNKVDVRFTSNQSYRFRGFSLDVRSISCTESGYHIQEVVVAAGETLQGAITSYVGSDGKYGSNTRQDWNIITDENQCIVITVGDGGFNTESRWDIVMFKDSNGGSETQRDGEYSSGTVLFISETNSVDITFTSDASFTESGFSLDIRSTSCTEAANLEEYEDTSDTDVICDGEDCTVEEVAVYAPVD